MCVLAAGVCQNWRLKIERLTARLTSFNLNIRCCMVGMVGLCVVNHQCGVLDNRSSAAAGELRSGLWIADILSRI